jgi:hypothetical protein
MAKISEIRKVFLSVLMQHVCNFKEAMMIPILKGQKGVKKKPLKCV